MTEVVDACPLRPQHVNQPSAHIMHLFSLGTQACTLNFMTVRIISKTEFVAVSIKNGFY